MFTACAVIDPFKLSNSRYNAQMFWVSSIAPCAFTRARLTIALEDAHGDVVGQLHPSAGRTEPSVP